MPFNITSSTLLLQFLYKCRNVLPNFWPCGFSGVLLRISLSQKLHFAHEFLQSFFGIHKITAHISILLLHQFFQAGLNIHLDGFPHEFLDGNYESNAEFTSQHASLSSASIHVHVFTHIWRSQSTAAGPGRAIATCEYLNASPKNNLPHDEQVRHATTSISDVRMCACVRACLCVCVRAQVSVSVRMRVCSYARVGA